LRWRRGWFIDGNPLSEFFMGFWVNTAYFSAMVPLTNAQIRVFKAQAQRLKATLKVGKEGLSQQFLAALDDALKHHELVKVKFDDFKEQKKELAPQLAEKSGSHLVTQLGNVVVLFRPKPVELQPG
jgi:RNA-binding protein